MRVAEGKTFAKGEVIFEESLESGGVETRTSGKSNLKLLAFVQCRAECETFAMRNCAACVDVPTRAIAGGNSAAQRAVFTLHILQMAASH